MVDGKEVDHFELSIDIKQAIADGVIEAGNDLCVNYTAVLNDKADFYIIGEGKNTNTAYLEYSNDPNGEGTGKTPESSVHAWTFAMIVSKIDGTTKTPLIGAKFVLSRSADLKVSDMQCDENATRPLRPICSRCTPATVREHLMSLPRLKKLRRTPTLQPAKPGRRQHNAHRDQALGRRGL